VAAPGGEPVQIHRTRTPASLRQHLEFPCLRRRLLVRAGRTLSAAVRSGKTLTAPAKLWRVPRPEFFAGCLSCAPRDSEPAAELRGRDTNPAGAGWNFPRD